jgi:hypothetical protein
VDSREKKLVRKVNKAAGALRKALNAHKSVAELNRLGDALAGAQRELARYKQNQSPR